MPQEESTDFAAMLKAELPALLLYARQWPHDSQEDVVQEAFISLYRQHPPPENVTAWLFAVVRNLSNKSLRSRNRRKTREIDFSHTTPAWFTPVRETDEEMQAVLEQLQRLPRQCCEIIVAKIWGKLTFEQIAAVYGSSSSTVHRKYQTGIKILHKKLTEQGLIP
ncbi:MAG: sigma-70 family RNA polymerase sigma factor [Planctomycetaceae bacterium]|jgi:RNA polymerase sigma-70 factor (ECF subfamily)|nr:sigma-70 family RNA polymerase sigma factor [Planctomycetaceae bacterium]